jgi:hypothetical protein
MIRTSIAKLADIGAEQWGLVTTAQARAADITPQAMARLARTGQLERLAHGIYRLAGTPYDLRDELRAAWLAIDPRHSPTERLDDDDLAVVSHRSAAVVLELGDVDADVHEFTAPHRHQSRRADLRFHRGHVTHDEWTLVSGLPVTTPVRTIADLAASHLDRGHLAGVVRDALVRYDIPAATLAAELADYAYSYGVTAGAGSKLLEVMLDEAGVPASTVDAVRHSRTMLEQLSTSKEFRALLASQGAQAAAAQVAAHAAAPAVAAAAAVLAQVLAGGAPPVDMTKVLADLAGVMPNVVDLLHSAGPSSRALPATAAVRHPADAGSSSAASSEGAAEITGTKQAGGDGRTIE